MYTWKTITRVDTVCTLVSFSYSLNVIEIFSFFLFFNFPRKRRFMVIALDIFESIEKGTYIVGGIFFKGLLIKIFTARMMCSVYMAEKRNHIKHYTALYPN